MVLEIEEWEPLRGPGTLFANQKEESFERAISNGSQPF